MNLESVVVGVGGGGEAGEVEGRGGEAHPSFPSSPGWRDSCGPPEEEEEEEEEEGVASAAHPHQSEEPESEEGEGEGWLLLQASFTVGQPCKQLGIAARNRSL